MNHILKFLIPTLLGDYVEGLDYNNIKASYFSGEVILENFSLRKNIFSQKGIPLDIAYSLVGKLELRVPWLKVRKEPIAATLSDVYMIITPSDALKIDPLRQRASLMNEISSKCYKQIKPNENKEEGKGGFSEMKINIIDNIQVCLKNIHIRFEDKEHNTAFGLVLEEFSTFTTNDKWEKEFLDRTMEANKLKNLYKKASISNLIGYCESESPKFLQSTDIADENRRKLLETSMKNYLPQEPVKIEDINNPSDLLFKISVDVKMVARSKHANLTKEPRVSMQLRVKQQNITIQHLQLENLLFCGDKAVSLGNANRYRPPKLLANEKEKKQKEFESVLRKFCELKKPTDVSWSEIYDKDKTQSGEAFRELLAVVDNEMITKSLNEVILDYEKQNLEAIQKKQGVIAGNNDHKEITLTKEQEQKADKFIEQLMPKNEEEINKNAEEFLFQIDLKTESGALLLINEGKKQDSAGILFEMTGFECQISSRNTIEGNNFQFDMKVDQAWLFLRSKYVAMKDSKSFNIIKSVNDKVGDKEKIFELSVSRTVGKSSEQLHVRSRVQEVIVNYLGSFVYEARQFISFKSRIHKLKDIAHKEMDNIRMSTEQNFQKLIHKGRKLEVNVDVFVASPRIVVPLKQDGDFSTDIWLINIGNLAIKTPSNSVYDAQTYHAVVVSLAGISLQHFSRWESWINKKLEAEHVDVLEETKTEVFLGIMHGTLQASSKASAYLLNCKLNPIKLNLDKAIVKKMIQLPNCLDYVRGNEYQQLLEVQKAQIMKTEPRIFKLLYGEERNLPCFGLFYEYFFYLYKNIEDVLPMKVIKLTQPAQNVKQIDEFYTIEVI